MRTQRILLVPALLRGALTAATAAAAAKPIDLYIQAVPEPDAKIPDNLFLSLAGTSESTAFAQFEAQALHGETLTLMQNTAATSTTPALYDLVNSAPNSPYYRAELAFSTYPSGLYQPVFFNEVKNTSKSTGDQGFFTLTGTGKHARVSWYNAVSASSEFVQWLVCRQHYYPYYNLEFQSSALKNSNPFPVPGCTAVQLRAVILPS